MTAAENVLGDFPLANACKPPFKYHPHSCKGPFLPTPLKAYSNKKSSVNVLGRARFFFFVHVVHVFLGLFPPVQTGLKRNIVLVQLHTCNLSQEQTNKGKASR